MTEARRQRTTEILQQYPLPVLFALRDNLSALQHNGAAITALPGLVELGKMVDTEIIERG